MIISQDSEAWLELYKDSTCSSLEGPEEYYVLGRQDPGQDTIIFRDPSQGDFVMVTFTQGQPTGPIYAYSSTDFDPCGVFVGKLRDNECYSIGDIPGGISCVKYLYDAEIAVVDEL